MGVRGSSEAHLAVATALADGRLVRPPSCEACGTVGTVDGHHADYAKPLDVEWLCRSCHKHRHAVEGPGKANPEARQMAVMNVRLPRDLIARVDAAACAEGVSRSAWIRGALEAALVRSDEATGVQGLATRPSMPAGSSSPASPRASRSRPSVPRIPTVVRASQLPAIVARERPAWKR